MFVNQTNVHAGVFSGNFKIDAQDSVNLKFTEAVLVDDIITIPIYIESDDDINSLDFSLVFNNEKFTYLSVIDHTGHIQYTDFFNPNDYTLRFTSNSFSLYAINKKIISIRFKVSSPCVETNDVFSMISYLNGDLCSSKLPQAVICRTSTEENDEVKIQVYPNPTSGQVHIIAPSDAVVTMISSNGTMKKTFEAKLNANEIYTIATNNYPSGMYWLLLDMDQKSTGQVIIIRHD
ncbi:MAG: T9SS type A sorting domain-containing protein [Saprospiraceae bacterium]|nr:T9SS type A sorting domain-containing protein [Saprospiraceae bacterium]MBK9045124.1 T9SS type A sorting domain-containing protein [Saprospiraceae bacterium]